MINYNNEKTPRPARVHSITKFATTHFKSKAAITKISANIIQYIPIISIVYDENIVFKTPTTNVTIVKMKFIHDHNLAMVFISHFTSTILIIYLVNLCIFIYLFLQLLI